MSVILTPPLTNSYCCLLMVPSTLNLLFNILNVVKVFVFKFTASIIPCVWIPICLFIYPNSNSC